VFGADPNPLNNRSLLAVGSTQQIESANHPFSRKHWQFLFRGDYMVLAVLQRGVLCFAMYCKYLAIVHIHLSYFNNGRLDVSFEKRTSTNLDGISFLLICLIPMCCSLYSHLYAQLYKKKSQIRPRSKMVHLFACFFEAIEMSKHIFPPSTIRFCQKSMKMSGMALFCSSRWLLFGCALGTCF